MSACGPQKCLVFVPFLLFRVVHPSVRFIGRGEKMLFRVKKFGLIIITIKLCQDFFVQSEPSRLLFSDFSVRKNGFQK